MNNSTKFPGILWLRTFLFIQKKKLNDVDEIFEYSKSSIKLIKLGGSSIGSQTY
jgi:hypothetical protein